MRAGPHTPNDCGGLQTQGGVKVQRKDGETKEDMRQKRNRDKGRHGLTKGENKAVKVKEKTR